MAWPRIFPWAVSVLGHAALFAGTMLLPEAKPAPANELVLIDAPDLTPPTPTSKTEPPAAEKAPEPKEQIARPEPNVPPPATEEAPTEEPAKTETPDPGPQSDNPYDDPSLLAADSNATGGPNQFAMHSGTGSQLRARTRPAPPVAVAPKAKPKPTITGVLQNWRARVGGVVVGAAGRRYPESARRDGDEGTVVLTMAVDTRGHVTSVDVVQSSGHRILDQAAVAAVRGLNSVPPPPPELHASLSPFAVRITYRIQ